MVISVDGLVEEFGGVVVYDCEGCCCPPSGIVLTTALPNKLPVFTDKEPLWWKKEDDWDDWNKEVGEDGEGEVKREGRGLDEKEEDEGGLKREDGDSGGATEPKNEELLSDPPVSCHQSKNNQRLKTQSNSKSINNGWI